METLEEEEITVNIDALANLAQVQQLSLVKTLINKLKNKKDRDVSVKWQNIENGNILNGSTPVADVVSNKMVLCIMDE